MRPSAQETLYALDTVQRKFMFDASVFIFYKSLMTGNKGNFDQSKCLIENIKKTTFIKGK